MHNHFLMELLGNTLKNAAFRSFQDLGFEPDAKEVIYFAVLANEALAGDGFQLNINVQGEPINLGKISLPE